MMFGNRVLENWTGFKFRGRTAGCELTSFFIGRITVNCGVSVECSEGVASHTSVCGVQLDSLPFCTNSGSNFRRSKIVKIVSEIPFWGKVQLKRDGTR
jgi:hypothetical protein